MNSHLTPASTAQHMELAADVAELGIFVRDEDRVGGEWNAQMYRLFRLDPAQGLPSQAQWLALVHPDDRERMTHSCEPILGQDAGFIEHEYRVRFSGDEVRWMSQRARHETLDGRSVLLGITTDVTERIEAESARRDSLLGEREGHARAELLARISHELRTPLHAVLGFAQMLQHEFADPTARPRTRIDPIVTAGQHLLALINDLLDLSNLLGPPQSLAATPVSVAEVVREVLLFVEGPARASRVTLRAGSLEGVVGCERARLRQVLIHLLTNAVKYNREGGEAAIHTTVGAHTVTLVVQDNGPGVSREQIARMFEPLNRLGLEHSGIDGAGMGLAIVKALIGHVGGQLRVSSEPGRGTRLEVELPLSTLQPAAVKPPPPAKLSAAVREPAGAGLQRARLLYIEDNPVNAMLVQELVNSHTRLDIVIEDTGTLGVARAREMRPELVLIDMQLPDFAGVEVLRQLKADPETAQLTCIALSANAVPAYIARAMAAGFDDYWTKPIDFNEFIGALERLFPNAVHLTPLQ